MAGESNTIPKLIQLIKSEYHEVPGLNLTKPQMQRLWGFDADMCDALVDALVASRVLRPSQRGTYVLDSR
jgi:hypothetical protein